jgi:hypothetical protein
MDDFVSLFMKSLRGLGRSPVLLLAGFAVGVLSLPLLAGYGGLDEATRAIAVDFSQLLLPLVIMPFITGGALGYAAEVRNNGSSSLSTFIGSATKNYIKMLVAGIISFVVFYFLLTGIMVFLLAGTSFGPFIGSIMGFLMLALTFFVLMSIEFYDIDIVAKGGGIMGAFRNSMDFVRRNLRTAVGFFILALIFKALVQMPLSFGLAGAMISNETYYNALTSANASINATSLLSMEPVAIGPGLLIGVAIFQVLIQGFVFALLALFKAEVYLTVKSRKKITDFDYDFSDEKAPEH